jgi:hypothetical protein
MPILGVVGLFILGILGFIIETIFKATAVRFNLVVLPASSLPSMVYSDFRVSTI